MPISLLSGADSVSPLLARNVTPRPQTIQQPEIGNFGGANFSAPTVAALKFGGDIPTIEAPRTASFTPFFDSPASSQLATNYSDLTHAIMAPNVDFARGIQAPSSTGFEPMSSSNGHYKFDPTFGRAPTPEPGTGTSTSLGGDWAGVDQWDAQIQAAASATGVDPNILKAIMKLESNGDPNAAGSAGVWGPMQVNSNAWGDGPWMHDASANILKGAQILKGNLDQYGGDMTMALRAYHGFGSDGNTTDQQYADIVMGNYNQLKAGGGTSTTGGVGSSAGMTGLFGAGANVQPWGSFNVESSNGLYGYGTQYGMDGTAHTGLDIVMAYGTPYKAAFSGTVVCSGTGQGAGADGTQGCAAFNDMIGGGAGRVEIQSDDGNTVLIYGHSSKSDFSAGQHVGAGQWLGASGGENSPHTHLEMRVRDASQPSGWRIVDPSSVLGGAGVSTSSAGYNATPAYQNSTTRVGGSYQTPQQAANAWASGR